jgi:hypothetical protein
LLFISIYPNDRNVLFSFLKSKNRRAHTHI